MPNHILKKKIRSRGAALTFHLHEIFANKYSHKLQDQYTRSRKRGTMTSYHSSTRRKWCESNLNLPNSPYWAEAFRTEKQHIGQATQNSP